MPRIDRASTDLQRLACVVVDIVGKAQCVYCLRCSTGVIQRCYHAGDLELFSGDFSIHVPVEGWENDTRVTVQAAAKMQAPWNVFTANKCNCRIGSCNNLRCHCMNECSTHCHCGKMCSNKLNICILFNTKVLAKVRVVHWKSILYVASICSMCVSK